MLQVIAEMSLRANSPNYLHWHRLGSHCHPEDTQELKEISPEAYQFLKECIPTKRSMYMRSNLVYMNRLDDTHAFGAFTLASQSFTLL